MAEFWLLRVSDNRGKVVLQCSQTQSQWWCLCLTFVLNRTSPEQVRPFVGDRDEVPEQVPEQVREVGSF